MPDFDFKQTMLITGFVFPLLALALMVLLTAIHPHLPLLKDIWQGVGAICGLAMGGSLFSIVMNEIS